MPPLEVTWHPPTRSTMSTASRFSPLVLLSLITMLTACAGSGEPPPGELPIAAAPLSGPSVYALLGEREDLGLTSAQISALDSIGTWLSTANRELRDDVGGVRRDRTSPDDLPEATRSALDRIRDNNAQAMRGIEATLTPDQRDSVCRMERERRERRAEERSDRPDRPQPTRGRFDVRGPGGEMLWSWCQPPAETSGP